MIEIPAVIERCAGIDIGKRELAVALVVGPADRDGEVTTRAFGTTVPELEKLKLWLIQEGCTSVAMESTGSYWIPVKNILEGNVEIVLVCPRKHKPERGDKTDFRDAKNLAHLHRHGLLTGSFLPDRNIVELRDLTRRRKKLLSNLAAEKNRIQKVLEVANVKIGNIVSDVFGVSGQEMVSALLSGEELEADQVAQLARRKLRQRIPELTEALARHQMNEHHGWLIGQSVEHAVLLDRQMEQLEERIKHRLEPYREQYELLQTIPGVKEMTGASILAEIGADMSQFETAKHLCSWSGICPGNNRSAGKNKHSHIKKGNKFLLAALAEAGWGAARKNGSIFQRKFHRWMKRLGKKKANVAIARSLLTVAYAILKEGRPYQAPDPKQMHEVERAKLFVITARGYGNWVLMTNSSPRWSLNSPHHRRSAPPPQRNRPSRMRPSLASAESHRQKSAVALWDSGLAKPGHKNIRVSRIERPERLHRDGLNQNALNNKNKKPRTE